MINKSKYYYIIGLFILILYPVNLFLEIIPKEFSWCIFLFAFASFTVKKDILANINLKYYLRLAIPFLAFVILILAGGNGFWHSVLKLELKNPFIINLNNLFKGIPFNDASFTRIFQTPVLTTYMKMVYNTGFVLAVLIPLFRAALTMDLKKMLKYTLSSHVFQVFIITPFYFIFNVREVWFINGNPDMLLRNLTGSDLIETTLNCLPSMHTSIAFAMFLLILKEKDIIFKYVWGFYCLSVIYSTMYLEIHWVIDVLGGVLLGYFTVVLSDFVIAKYYDVVLSNLETLFNKKASDVITSEIQ